MRTLVNLMFLILLSTLPMKAALALDCYLGASGGPVEETKTILPFAIPGNSRTGQKIWESDDIKIPVTCNHNVASGLEPENIFAWVNPYPAATDPYYELGVTYEGMDYAATGQPSGVDTRHCLDNNNMAMYTPEQIRQKGWEKLVCSGNADDIHTTRTFVARLRLFVKIKAMPPHGYVSSLGDYIVVQFDGKGELIRWLARKTSNITSTACKILPYSTAGRRSAFYLRTRRSTSVPLTHAISSLSRRVGVPFP